MERPHPQAGDHAAALVRRPSGISLANCFTPSQISRQPLPRTAAVHRPMRDTRKTPRTRKKKLGAHMLQNGFASPRSAQSSPFVRPIW